ncbi:MAG: hypothetical protein LBS74_10495 [Oscillospiraceae bacterium]|jgi:hypothetical protein|nr:hypothetical protein [Oscillospiraceae bacterium]
MSYNKEQFYKKKKKIIAETETFRSFYFDTVDTVYLNVFTRVLNHKDAVSVLIDTYTLMYDELKTLRKAPSRIWWIRKYSNEGYRKSLRGRNLTLAHECEPTDEFPKLTENQKHEVWHQVLKMRDINEFATVPVPSVLSRASGGVFAPILGRIKAMPLWDKIIILAIVLACIGASIAITVLVLKIAPKFMDKEVVETQKEIFLPDSAYEGFVFEEPANYVDAGRINQAVLQAKDRADALDSLISKESTSSAPYFDPAWTSKPKFGSAPDVPSMEPMGNVQGLKSTTGDEQFDAEISKTLNYIINDQMSDKDKVFTIYSFVCHYGRYEQNKHQEPDFVNQARDFFLHSGGDSKNYSAAFKVLCDAAGYPSSLVEGEFIIQNSDGTQTLIEHTWATLVLNGLEYHFDPEADCDKNAENIRTNYFLAARGNSKWELFIRDHRWQ